MGYTDLEKPIAEGKIANALKSTAADHVVAKAENIYDTDLKGYQSEINSDFTNKFNDYLPLAGGTMTGDLTIKRNSSDSPSIILQRAETNDTFEDWRMSNVGGNFKIQNRNSGNTWVDVLSLAPSATKTLTSSYSVLPSANNTLTLGNSTYKWKDVYATNFNGALKGNADTATSATYIKTSGKLIAETTTNRASGLRLYEIYSNGYPCTYGNVLQFNGANGVGQLACQWHGTGLWYRSAPDTSTTFTDWSKILTDTNTSVEGGGSTWGSSITVNIGGTSKTLTIPANPNTNTAHNHAVGVGLICDNTTATTSGTVTYKAKLKSETASTLDSTAMGSTANRQYAVGVDKSGYLSVNIPWTDTNTDTKNTTGATNSASKMYLIGATSQDTNPQTYSNSNVYATNGDLVANSFQGSIKGTSADNVNTAYKDLHFRFYNNVTGCDSTVSTDGKRYAGTANSYGFPVSNNANAMLWLGAHSGNYGHQLGFSSDGRIYDRYISNGSFPTTVNGGSWKKIAFTSDIPTKTSSLTNDSGYLTSIETATTAEITALFN